MNQETKEKVKKVIEEKVRPNLRMDGGDIELVDVTDEGVVKVRLKGACAHCPFSSMTVAVGVEQTIKEIVPEVVRIEPVI
ncbi:MAG: NifU family protein [candidate division WOR-3 bacterium]|jgi:Fe-S cluster biogenesis protein NfuA|nr:NifU family protein [candidate division WOR-3 bacterium]MCR4423105.1 NifU family protein [candidate division WOR-3 bacterium]MDH7518444.1 NifU family protein [bacterium]